MFPYILWYRNPPQWKTIVKVSIMFNNIRSTDLHQVLRYMCAQTLAGNEGEPHGSHIN